MKGKLGSVVSLMGFVVSAVSEYGLSVNFPLTPALWLVIAVVALSVTSAHGAPNIWVNTASGTWEWGTSGNWSLAAAPSINQDGIFITNVVNESLSLNRFRFVSIDSTTPAGSMTISNLTVADVGIPISGTRNSVILNSAATTFHVYGALVISNSASVSISNSVLLVENPGLLANDVLIDNGSLLLNTGSLITTGATSFVIGESGFGQMTVQDGTWLAMDVTVGGFGTGTLTLAGGTNLFGGILAMGVGAGTGTVWVTGGQVTATNATTLVGEGGIGQVIVTNGTVRLKAMGIPGPSGTLTIAGGTTTIASNLAFGGLPGSAVWITGGQLTVNRTVQIGVNGGSGHMTVSSGTVSVNELVVASENVFDFGSNTLAIVGGTISVYSNITMGSVFCPTSSEVAASVTLTGGSLYVTNAAHNASLNIPYGNFMQSGGTLVVDQLIVADPCGHFIHSGGTLSIMSTNLDPNSSAAGDGIPNGWKQQYGFDPFHPNLADEDPDGDGLNNLAEYLAGTNPTNSRSALRIISAIAQGDDILLRWTTAGGHTNSVQATDGTANGSFTNDFTDLVWFFMGGAGDKTNTFIDFGGATGTPSRYYRIRLVP